MTYHNVFIQDLIVGDEVFISNNVSYQVKVISIIDANSAIIYYTNGFAEEINLYKSLIIQQKP